MLTYSGWTALFLVLMFVLGLIGFSGAAGEASRTLLFLGIIFAVAALVSWLLAPRPAKNRTRRNI